MLHLRWGKFIVYCFTAAKCLLNWIYTIKTVERCWFGRSGDLPIRNQCSPDIQWAILRPSPHSLKIHRTSSDEYHYRYMLQLTMHIVNINRIEHNHRKFPTFTICDRHQTLSQCSKALDRRLYSLWFLEYHPASLSSATPNLLNSRTLADILKYSISISRPK